MAARAPGGLQKGGFKGGGGVGWDPASDGKSLRTRIPKISSQFMEIQSREIGYCGARPQMTSTACKLVARNYILARDFCSKFLSAGLWFYISMTR